MRTYLILFLILIFLFTSCFSLKLQTQVLSTYPGGLPCKIEISIVNNNLKPIKIYDPSESFYFFWSIIVFRNTDSTEYLVRTDKEWSEPSIRLINKYNRLIDTITIIPNTFYKPGKNTPCTPLINADSFKFVYENAGHLNPKVNLTGVMVYDTTYCKPTLKGKFISNRIKLPHIYADSLQMSFTDSIIGIPLITIEKSCD